VTRTLIFLSKLRNKIRYLLYISKNHRPLVLLNIHKTYKYNLFNLQLQSTYSKRKKNNWFSHNRSILGILPKIEHHKTTCLLVLSNTWLLQVCWYPRCSFDINLQPTLTTSILHSQVCAKINKHSRSRRQQTITF